MGDGGQGFDFPDFDNNMFGGGFSNMGGGFGFGDFTFDRAEKLFEESFGSDFFS